jgi:hypothetical protein
MSFNSCVYENLRGVASDLAAKSIKVACLRNSSIEIPIDDLIKLKGQSEYGTFNNHTGYILQLTNNLEYILTELTIGISVKNGPIKYYRIDDFHMPPAPGVLVTGLPPDPTVSMRIDPLTSKTFFFGERADVDLKKTGLYDSLCLSEGNSNEIARTPEGRYEPLAFQTIQFFLAHLFNRL